MSIIVDTWEAFADATIETKDLDPMYDFIWEARRVKGPEWADRFALHFFMFYNAGEAVKAAEYDGPFWSYVEFGYASFKRGTERRHFRGDRGASAVRNLRKFGNPSSVWDALHEGDYLNLVANVESNFGGCQIGPYFMWKAMDLMDRCLGRPVDVRLPDAAKFMPDEPRKCSSSVFPGVPIRVVLTHIADRIKRFPAPGNPNRMCSYPEAETVLCMLKGYFLTKTHVIGDDIDEKYDQLAQYPDMQSLLPSRIVKSNYVRRILEPTSVPT